MLEQPPLANQEAEGLIIDLFRPVGRIERLVINGAIPAVSTVEVALMRQWVGDLLT